MTCSAGVGIHRLSRYVRPVLIDIRRRSLFHLRSLSVLCRPCNSPWLNKVLERGHRLASPQGLPHFRHVRHTTGQRVCSIEICCLKTAHSLQMHQTDSFCVAAGFPRPCCAAQALPEPPAARPVGTDLRLLTPQLQKQWHHAKNQHLKDIQVHPNSHLRVWWTCDQCPCGLPHEWLAKVYNRQGTDNQCPFCTNKSLCHHNFLLTEAPFVAAYWDTAKNGVTADQMLAGSNARRHWLCPTCKYSWQAPVYRRVDNNSGCPK